MLQASLRVVRTRGLDVLEQLRLEEAVFRCDVGNWLLVNDGVPTPTVVMGMSGKVEKMVDAAAVQHAGVRVLRRFTGGGTVVVDDGSVMVSFIGNDADVLPRPLYGPRALMDWSASLYGDALSGCTHASHAFGLNEQDYVFGPRKCAGNAQGLSKGRFVHHTSWLWAFREERMQLLSNPEKQPAYRRRRDHSDFLVPLSSVDGLPSRPAFIDRVLNAASSRFSLEAAGLEDMVALLAREHRQATKTVSVEV